MKHPNQSASILIEPDKECHVKAFDGKDRVVTFRCAPCPVCGKWLTVNPEHRFCQYCGQAIQFSVNKSKS